MKSSKSSKKSSMTLQEIKDLLLFVGESDKGNKGQLMARMNDLVNERVLIRFGDKIIPVAQRLPKSPKRSSPKGPRGPKGKEEYGTPLLSSSPISSPYRTSSPSPERTPSPNIYAYKVKAHEKRIERISPPKDVLLPSPDLPSPKSDETGVYQVGEYAVDFDESIGRGTYGEIYKARKGKKEYAAKVINKRDNNDGIRKIVNNEKIALRVDHPNVVTYHDYMETESNYIFIMDLYNADFHDIFLMIEKRYEPQDWEDVFKLPEERVKYYFRQMYEAVLYLHTHKIAHRDIKLENFLYKRRGDKIAISDFGFAVTWEGPNPPIVDHYEGSPYFAAPEIFKGEKHPATTPDLWALGVCLFVLLTGEYPFESLDRNKQMFIKKVLEDQPKIRSRFDRSQEAETLVNLLLEKDFKKRITITEVMGVGWL